MFFTRGLRGGKVRELLLKRTDGGRSRSKLSDYPPEERKGLAALVESPMSRRPGEISWFGAA